MSRHLSYANIVATLALFVALGGGALALSKIGSKDIRNHSIKSIDLRDRKGVAGKDVRRNSLKGSEIAEGTLDGSHFAPIVGSEGTNCDPSSSTDHVECAAAPLRLGHSARV